LTGELQSSGLISRIQQLVTVYQSIRLNILQYLNLEQSRCRQALPQESYAFEFILNNDLTSSKILDSHNGGKINIVVFRDVTFVRIYQRRQRHIQQLHTQVAWNASKKMIVHTRAGQRAALEESISGPQSPE